MLQEGDAVALIGCAELNPDNDLTQAMAARGMARFRAIGDSPRGLFFCEFYVNRRIIDEPEVITPAFNRDEWALRELRATYRHLPDRVRELTGGEPS